MPHIDFWLKPLVGHIRSRAISQPFLGDVESIRFLHTGTVLSPNTLYLGTQTAVSAYLSGVGDAAEGHTFFSAGRGAVLHKAEGVNLIETDLDLFRLHDMLADTMLSYRCWQQKFAAASGKNATPRDVAQAVESLTGAKIFFLDRRLYALYVDARVIASEKMQGIFENGRLTNTFEEQLAMLSEGGNGTSYLLRMSVGGKELVFCRPAEPQDQIAYLLLCCDAAADEFDIHTLLRFAKDALAALSSDTPELQLRRMSFHALLFELVEKQTHDPEEIVRLISALEYPLDTFGRIVLIDFDGGAENAPKFIESLTELFPETNLCMYKGQVVLLVSRGDRFPNERDWLNAAAFQSLLVRYRAFAMIATPSSRYDQLRTPYILAQRMLAIVKRLWRTDALRYFYFDDYAEYLTIDLCFRSYTQLVGHEDMIYLTQPELIKIYRHDRDEDDNLLDVLYYYCLNDCSISKTAQAVYMHRNTVAAKVEKLKNLITADLSDGNVQQRMVFSYRVLRYTEVFCEKKPEILLSRQSES